MSAAQVAVGDTARFALYDLQGVRPVEGPVVQVQASRRTGQPVSVTVDLTSQERGRCPPLAEAVGGCACGRPNCRLVGVWPGP